MAPRTVPQADSSNRLVRQARGASVGPAALVRPGHRLARAAVCHHSNTIANSNSSWANRLWALECRPDHHLVRDLEDTPVWDLGGPWDPIRAWWGLGDPWYRVDPWLDPVDLEWTGWTKGHYLFQEGTPRILDNQITEFTNSIRDYNREQSNRCKRAIICGGTLSRRNSSRTMLP